MRLTPNLVARSLIVLHLVMNVAYAQSVETPEVEAVAPAESSSFARFLFATVVSAVAVVEAVVTNSPLDSVGYLAVAIGADQLRE